MSGEIDAGRMIFRAQDELKLLEQVIRNSPYIGDQVRAWALEHELGLRKIVIALSYARDGDKPWEKDKPTGGNSQ